jgi:hypothetical protein
VRRDWIIVAAATGVDRRPRCSAFVDESALLRALHADAIAGEGLEIYDVEPLRASIRSGSADARC